MASFAGLSLAFLATLLQSCGASPPVARCESAQPDWVSSVPSTCEVGTSGPTLNPRDAPRNAEMDARVELAHRILGVDVDSRLVTGTGHRDVTLSEMNETIAGLGTRAFWTDTCGEGPLKKAQISYALVCLGDPQAPCAVGTSGPTLAGGDALDNAEEDARRRLAEQRELHLQSTSLDDSDDRLRRYAGGEATGDLPEAEEVECRRLRSDKVHKERGAVQVLCCMSR